MNVYSKPLPCVVVSMWFLPVRWCHYGCALRSPRQIWILLAVFPPSTNHRLTNGHSHISTRNDQNLKIKSIRRYVYGQQIPNSKNNDLSSDLFFFMLVQHNGINVSLAPTSDDQNPLNHQHLPTTKCEAEFLVQWAAGRQTPPIFTLTELFIYSPFEIIGLFMWPI